MGDGTSVYTKKKINGTTKTHRFEHPFGRLHNFYPLVFLHSYGSRHFGRQNDPKIWQVRSLGSINDYVFVISELFWGLLPASKEHVIDLSSKKRPNMTKSWFANELRNKWRNSVDRPTQNAADKLTKRRIRRWWVKRSNLGLPTC